MRKFIEPWLPNGLLLVESRDGNQKETNFQTCIGAGVQSDDKLQFYNLENNTT